MKTERKQSIQKDEPQKVTQLRGSHQASGEPQNEYHPLQESRRGHKLPGSSLLAMFRH